MKTGIELITEERKRQVEVEGFTLLHDLKYKNQELAKAAVAYTISDHFHPMDSSAEQINGVFLSIRRTVFWPFKFEWFKPSNNRIEELTKAGALIAAEIDRIQALGKTF